MSKFRNWIIRKLGGIPKDELSRINPKIEISETELIEIESKFIVVGTHCPAEDEIHFIKGRLIGNILSKIHFPIESRKNFIDGTTEYSAIIKIPKEYIRSDEDE